MLYHPHLIFMAGMIEDARQPRKPADRAGFQGLENPSRIFQGLENRSLTFSKPWKNHLFAFPILGKPCAGLL
jgi:hypothetical protein